MEKSVHAFHKVISEEFELSLLITFSLLLTVRLSLPKHEEDASSQIGNRRQKIHFKIRKLIFGIDSLLHYAGLTLSAAVDVFLHSLLLTYIYVFKDRGMSVYILCAINILALSDIFKPV